MIRETLWWHRPKEKLPDDETTVLVCVPNADEPIWLGYRDAGKWYWADGTRITQRVAYWAEMPGAAVMEARK